MLNVLISCKEKAKTQIQSVNAYFAVSEQYHIVSSSVFGYIPIM